MRIHWNKVVSIAAVGILLGIAGARGQADVSLSSVISDNMVLQQQTSVRIFGKADPAEKVTVAIQGQTQATAADASGKWVVMLQRPVEHGVRAERSL